MDRRGGYIKTPTNLYCGYALGTNVYNFVDNGIHADSVNSIAIWFVFMYEQNMVPSNQV